MRRLPAIVLVMALFLASCGGEYGKSSREYKNMVKQAEDMADALEAGDDERVLKYYNENLVEILGGKQQMINIFKEQRRVMKQRDIKFDDVEMDNYGDIVDTADMLQNTVEETIAYKLSNGDVTSETYMLIATSEDDGQSWRFVDVTEVADDELQRLVPNVSTKIKDRLR